MEKKYIYGGAAILSIGGFVLYRRMKKNAAPPPDSSRVDNASTDALNFSTPAMMYAPAGGGAMGISSADTSGASNAPTVSAVTGSGSGGSLADIIAGFAKTQGTSTTNAADVAALSTLNLSPGSTASVSHTDGGTSVTVSAAPKNTSISKNDLLKAIHTQAVADKMSDDKVTSSYVQYMANRLNVSVEQIGAAYGQTADSMAQWMAAH
jgi:hypothetical protein